MIVAVACPHCEATLDIVTNMGPLFTCTSCSEQFEFETEEYMLSDEDEHYWDLVLSEAGCYNEKMHYISSHAGVLPQNCLVTLEEGGGGLHPVTFHPMSLYCLGIPTLIGYPIHLMLNRSRTHKPFYWTEMEWKNYFDPVARVYIPMKRYRNGWYPENLWFISNEPLVVDQVRYTRVGTVEGESDEGVRYDVVLNKEQTMTFRSQKDADAFIFRLQKYM